MDVVPQAYPGAAGTRAPLAGFWPRLGGYLIDGILLGVLQVVLAAVLGKQSAIYALVLLVVDVGYFLYFWSTTGQTLGDRVAGVRIVREDGGTLSLGGAAIRYLGLIVSTLVVFLGLLWVIWDRKKQGWHDKMAGTIVVKV